LLLYPEERGSVFGKERVAVTPVARLVSEWASYHTTTRCSSSKSESFLVIRSRMVDGALGILPPVRAGRLPGRA
jgi:hypothetical protein